MIKILFMIPNLGHGGAEKVLVNLVNNMDRSKFNVTVMTLYDEGVHRDTLASHISYQTCFKRSFSGVAHILKLFSPRFLYRRLVHGSYDIVVSYLEGQTARIISGCPDGAIKKVCWIHRTMTNLEDSARLFRNVNEAKKCYSSFDRIISVSKDVQDAFMDLYHIEAKGLVAYNTNLTDLILRLAKGSVPQAVFDASEFKICAMGTLVSVKGFKRLLNIHRKLIQRGYRIHTYILGEGPEEKILQNAAKQYGVEKTFTLLGYKKNPYAYMKHCDLFVCSSYSEGFSTAVTEALILGIPVVTTKVSGMRELLGENQEYGIVVDNNEQALFNGIKLIVDNQEIREHYQRQAKIKGSDFLTERTVDNIQKIFVELWEET